MPSNSFIYFFFPALQCTRNSERKHSAENIIRNKIFFKEELKECNQCIIDSKLFNCE